MVDEVHKLQVEGEIVYEIRRKKYNDRICVWLSDAYLFTDMDYVNRPHILKPGDYILIAKPEGGGGADKDLIESAKIGVGKIAELMGALNLAKMWKYVPPTEEQKRARRERAPKKNSF
jgi:hypothetical protein